MNAARPVAVTGATGFLGRHVVTALARAGVPVRVLARNIPDPQLWPGAAPEVVLGELADSAALARLTAGAAGVVHVAGLVRARDGAAFLRVNRDGTAALAAAARRLAPEARFVAVSSLAARVPGLSDYAASKAAGEAAARAAYADAPGRLAILRPPAIYGPGDRATLALFRAAGRAVAPVFGSGRIAVVHVADAAGAIARLALGAGEAGCHALADPTPGGYTMRELLEEAARAVGTTPRLVALPDGLLLAAGAAGSLWGRLGGRVPMLTRGKAREMLHRDWSVTDTEHLPHEVHRPRIGIAEGFRGTVAWYREAGWLR